MFARLTALVGSGTGLPFDVTEEATLAWCSWTHARGKWKADASAVSVFRVSSSNPADPKLTAARNGTKRLRTMRHPNVLVFKESLEIEEKGEHAVYLVTEPVTPLASFLETTELTGQDRQEYMSMGFHALVAAVAFLNIDCGLVHGGICAGSVAVTERLDWKLWGLDMLTEHTTVGPACPLAASAWLVAAQYKPGELGRGDWDALRGAPAWAVDAWGLGCLMQELYSGHALERLEDLRRTDVVPKPLVPWYQRLLASNPAHRASPAALCEAGVLRTQLVQTVAFLENLALKDSQEKDAFFKRLPGVLPGVPLPVRQRKILPLLAAALEYGGAPPSALGVLLSIGETMDDAGRAAAVVPVIAKLFASTDRSIRRGLLENVAAYGPALPDALVEEQIFGHLATGFTDANPYLRELTLKSMAVLGPKLGQKTLSQGLLKHLAKLQVDEEPSIRANTTVLLGALAPSLSEATCKKVLLNAFARALRDGFPPARAAGLRAMVATAKFHSPEEAAGRILPAVAPLCMDPVPDVRASAMECMETFVGVIRNYQEVLRARDAEKAAAAGGAAGGEKKKFAHELLHLSFNQDQGCFAVGTDNGFRVYNCEPFKETFRREFSNGGIGAVEMLFRSNILALVGGGPSPRYPPTKVMVWDDSKGRCIGELSFRSHVLRVALHRNAVAVALEHKVLVYGFADLRLAASAETAANPRGLLALAAGPDAELLACPGLHAGQVRLEWTVTRRTRFVQAHDSALGALALTPAGTHLATASEKGTLIRVWATADGTRLRELRRGADPARIDCLAFGWAVPSRSLVEPPDWLAVTSSHGTMHLFGLQPKQGQGNWPGGATSGGRQDPASPRDGAVGGGESPRASPVAAKTINPTSKFAFVSSYLPGRATKYFAAERSFAQFKLPDGAPTLVGFGAEAETLFLLSHSGCFYKLRFDSAQGGPCEQLSCHRFMEDALQRPGAY